VWGWFCCVSDIRSGVPAQDQPVPFLDEQASGPNPWKAIFVSRALL